MANAHDDNLRRIGQLLAGHIEPEEFAKLEDALARDHELRAAYVDLLQVEHDLRHHLPSLRYEPARRERFAGRAGKFLSWGVAAGLLLGFALWQFAAEKRTLPMETAEAEKPEMTVEGHATLRRLVDARWSHGARAMRVGDTLSRGRFAFEAGVAEIDMFCGASLLIEGPAQLELLSDWEVRCLQGRVRAYVPPAAQGFVLRAADSEIIDLGTEFVLDVNEHSARVHVIDGKVKVRDAQQRETEILAGQGQWLRGTSSDEAESLAALIDSQELSRRSAAAVEERFETWKADSEKHAADPRLIAYYPVARMLDTQRSISNVAQASGQRDGTLVGLVDRVDGRFGPASSGLAFSRPGARVRVRIDGTFSAFTFVCWAKIDSLDHRYNALFMGDGYENGEPHWQIRDDGQLMFSVMVDQARKRQHHSKLEGRTVTSGGWHYVYYSPPFWDPSMSGQWFHLASVYDPAARRVRHYVNGALLSEFPIEDEYYIDKLRIGPGEIGNWGRPFRATPSFAVRNLNGTVDELAIFQAALSGEEIHALYESGKPLSY